MRVLVRLLVMALVPVVWLGYHAPAAQAATLGDGATASFTTGGYDGLGGAQAISCSVNGQWSVDGAMSIVGVARCKTGWAISSAEVTLYASGSANCLGLQGGDVGQVDGHEARSFTMPGNAALNACAVTELCYSIEWTEHANVFGDSKTSDGCTAWDLGTPPAAPTPHACTQAEVSKPVAGPIFITGASFDYTNRYVDFNFPKLPLGPNDVWDLYVVRQGGGIFQLRTALPNAGPWRIHAQTSNGLPKGSGGPENLPIIGYGYARNASGQSQGAAMRIANPPSFSGVVGMNNPGACMFYWGQKLYDEPNSDRDEPAGPVELNPTPGEDGPPSADPVTDAPEPPAAGNPCEFSFSNPTTWVSAGVCQLVDLIRRLVDVVVKLPGRIANAIGALFIPRDGVIEGELDEVKEAWADSTVGNYLGAVTELDVPTASGGCAGPRVEFSVKGKDVSWQPLNACDGGMATLAGLAKLIIGIGLGLFGGIACLRAVGAGFGWSPKIGRDSE